MEANTNTKNRADIPLMELDGKVSPVRAFPYALQQILAMFISNLTPIWALTAICSATISEEMALVLAQNSMVISGIATLIQCTPIWKIGSGLPVFMGM
ncbi:MAG: hypothetical protein J5891_02860, partial [Spirochaetales bacterium]|nr:hypothetical protein [Spirochaetales bacterium]